LHPDPHSTAALLLQAGRSGEATALLERCCSERPDDARSWFLLGACRHASAELGPALAAFDRCLALEPGNLQAAQGAVAVLCQLGQPAAALERCKSLLSRHPNDAQLRFTTGLVQEALGDAVAALGHYDAALAVHPDFLPALQNRGIVLTRLGRIEEAIESNRRFVAAAPDRVDAHHNLAESLLAGRYYAEAARAAGDALAIDPQHASSRLDLGLALAADGRMDDAREALCRVPRNDPAVAQRVREWADAAGVVDPIELSALFQPEDIWLTMRSELLERCDWDGLEALTERCAGMIVAAPPASLRTRALAFKLLHLPLPASLQKTVADRIAQETARIVSALPRPARPPRVHGSRIRVGYLSADFGTHPVGFLTRSLYGLHDRTRFEILAYALAGDDGSENFRTIAAGCDRMTECRELPLEQLAARIAADGIDILVDLTGYTRAGRSPVLALRPAPINVVYVGYPSTLGGSLADYFIGDATAVPPSAEGFFSEKIVRLPHSYLPASHRSLPVAPPPSRSDEGLPEGKTVFCAFHRHVKIDPVAFATWTRILGAVPGSVLWLQQGPGEANLRRHAGDAGIDPARLVFAPHREHAAHIARQRLADLFLDTRCWNAHTTGADALWAGLPIVTCPGEHPVSRLGASLVHGMGLDELAVGGFDEYESLAVDLATHAEKLRTLKQKLAHNRETHPLFDVPRLVRNLESAYLEMWRLREAGDPPRSFDVEDHGPFAAPVRIR
jgi:protein O-GlcNAc transferase